MRKQLTTVQRNKRNRIIKRVIYGIILAIAIPVTYIYCSNAVNDFFDSLNTDISVSTSKTSNKKHISKVDNTDKETNVTGKENDENIVLNNNHKDTSNISEKKDTEEFTNNSTTTINNNDDNIEDRYSSFEPSISTDNTDSNEKTNTSLSVPKEIEDEYLTNKSNISQSISEEINKNNEEIAKIEQQREELDAINAKYDAKVSTIEAWYNEEFNKNYELMMEAKNTYEDLGGYATEDDKVQAYKDIKSAGVEAYNSGLEGSLEGRIKSLEKNYELVCKRYTYSQQYDEYYEYIYTTLPAKKTEKLSQVTQKYNEDLQNYKNKYGL